MSGWWDRDGRDDTLRRLIADGRSSSEIAEQMGTTRGAIAGRCHRLGLVIRGGRPAPVHRVSRKKAVPIERAERTIPNRLSLGSVGPATRTVTVARVPSLEMPLPPEPPGPPGPPAARIEPEPVEPEPMAPGGPVRFADLRPLGAGRRNQCRLFLAGEAGLNGLVCGAETAPGAAWCAACRARLFRPIRPTARGLPRAA